jgi:DNA-directed RNA polymerase subunit RPC12/RpoP
VSAHETTDTALAICPHCGFRDDASHELGRVWFCDTGEDECLKCGKLFEWDRTIIITYTTRKIND